MSWWSAQFHPLTRSLQVFMSPVPKGKARGKMYHLLAIEDQQRADSFENSSRPEEGKVPVFVGDFRSMFYYSVLFTTFYLTWVPRV